MKYENLGYNIPLQSPTSPAPSPAVGTEPSRQIRAPDTAWSPGSMDKNAGMTQLAAVDVGPSGGIWDIKNTMKNLNSSKKSRG